VREQHHVDRLAPGHAGCGIVAELRVVGEAQAFVEGPDLRQVCDRQTETKIILVIVRLVWLR